MALMKQRHLIVLLGDPVSQSLSPVIHNAALQGVGLNCTYEAVRVASADLERVVDRLRAGDYRGANITLPYKEQVVRYLDRLTPVAADLGAVNTIKVIENVDSDRIMLEGDNTDVFGFAVPLTEFAHRLHGVSCLVWGSGGAARAVVYALLNRFQTGQIYLVSRSHERANRVKEAIDTDDSRITIVPWTNSSDAVKMATLLVNATPLGMTPDLDTTPCLDPSVLSKEHIIYDLVYNPINTRLLLDGEKRGAATVSGLEMLIGQASQSFQVWTGTQMPVAIVRRALARHFEDNS